MDSDEGKLFIGGISWETTEENLKDHFSKYGEVLQAVIMKDKISGRPRGFGFVAFADASVLDAVLRDGHVIDGRNVEAKRALSREEQHTSARSGNSTSGRTTGGAAGGNSRTKKIFVGGLPSNLTEDEFRKYFESYGAVTDVVVMYDQSTQRPRGFGFISFDSEDAVDRVLHRTFHELNGKSVEVKRALPKDANSSSRSNGGGSYKSYGGSNANSNSYEGGADANRYVQPQAAGGSYAGYGSSGYAGYGYGAPSNGVGYGGYGMGGYGTAAVVYGGGGAYGNPNAAAGAYISGPRGAPRPWGSQAPGYAPAGYGTTTGYGATAMWNPAAAVGSGNVSASAGQSLSGTGYGKQGYGYGGFGGNNGYTNQGGYGTSGGQGGSGASTDATVNGAEQGPTSGYGNGYNNASSEYPNAWKSDPSQGGGYGVSQANGPSGGSAGYGGYGGMQFRQAPHQ